MIQRIQTLFLFLAALCAGLLFVTPLMSWFSVPKKAAASLQGIEKSVLADRYFDVTDNPVLLAVMAAAAALLLVAVFLFKNRKTQALLTRVGLICALIGLLLVGFFFYLDYQNLPSTPIEVEYGFIPSILTIVFSGLGLRFIKKDEKLVRSMDRLR